MSQPSHLLRRPDTPCRWLRASDEPTRAAAANQLPDEPQAVTQIHQAAPKDLKTGPRMGDQSITRLAAETGARLKSP